MPQRLSLRPHHIASRGVYEHPFVGHDGERFLFAVDSRGRRVMEATVYPECDDPGAITRILRDALDRIDQQRHLRLLP